jgi:hypothetical protein
MCSPSHESRVPHSSIGGHRRSSYESLIRCASIVKGASAYSGSGRPFVSGANGSAAKPTRNTRHIVTPAYRSGSS